MKVCKRILAALLSVLLLLPTLAVPFSALAEGEEVTAAFPNADPDEPYYVVGRFQNEGDKAEGTSEVTANDGSRADYPVETYPNLVTMGTTTVTAATPVDLTGWDTSALALVMDITITRADGVTGANSLPNSGNQMLFVNNAGANVAQLTGAPYLTNFTTGYNDAAGVTITYVIPWGYVHTNGTAFVRDAAATAVDSLRWMVYNDSYKVDIDKNGLFDDAYAMNVVIENTRIVDTTRDGEGYKHGIVAEWANATTSFDEDDHAVNIYPWSDPVTNYLTADMDISQLRLEADVMYTGDIDPAKIVNGQARLLADGAEYSVSGWSNRKILETDTWYHFEWAVSEFQSGGNSLTDASTITRFFLFNYNDDFISDENGNRIHNTFTAHVKNIRIVDTTVHEWETEWTVDVEPTCTEAGSKSRHCTLCGDVTEVTEIPALGHSWTLINHKDPTCIADGYNDYVCENDSSHTKRDTVKLSDVLVRFSSFEGTYGRLNAGDNMLYADWKLADGISGYVSGYDLQTNYPNRDGLYLKATIDLTTSDGSVDPDTAWTQLTVKLRSPDVVDKPDDPDLKVNGGDRDTNAEHNYGWTITPDMVAMENGRLELSIPLNRPADTYRGLMDWTQVNRIRMYMTVSDTGVESMTLSDVKIVAEDKAVADDGHNYSTEWTVDVEPTCTEAGSKSHHCTLCGDKADVTEIPALEHSWTLINHKDPTCIVDGYNDYVCENDSTHTKREVLYGLPTFVVEEEITSTEAHYLGITVTPAEPILTSGRVLHFQLRVNKTEQLPQDSTVADSVWLQYLRNGRVIVSGTDVATLTCGVGVLADVTETGVWVDVTVPLPDSIETVDSVRLFMYNDLGSRYGSELNYSNDAGVTISVRNMSVATKAHAYSTEWTIDQVPTCTEPGSQSHHCTLCGDKTDVTEVPATGHDWKLLMYQDATDTEDGFALYGCQHDSTHTYWETIKATDKPVQVVYGDVNSNGMITAEDALTVLLAATGKIALTEQEFLAGDVDGDGMITANDALFILYFSVSKIATFPVEG